MDAHDERWREEAGVAARTLGVAADSSGLPACPHPHAIHIVEIPAGRISLVDGDYIYTPTTSIAYLCGLCYSLFIQTGGRHGH